MLAAVVAISRTELGAASHASLFGYVSPLSLGCALCAIVFFQAELVTCLG